MKKRDILELVQRTNMWVILDQSVETYENWKKSVKQSDNNISTNNSNNINDKKKRKKIKNDENNSNNFQDSSNERKLNDFYCGGEKEEEDNNETSKLLSLVLQNDDDEPSLLSSSASLEKSFSKEHSCSAKNLFTPVLPDITKTAHQKKKQIINDVDKQKRAIVRLQSHFSLHNNVKNNIQIGEVVHLQPLPISLEACVSKNNSLSIFLLLLI